MMNLEISSSATSTNNSNDRVFIPRWATYSFIIFSFLGFLDAAYLTATHYFGIPLQCSILNGCELVTTSNYAIIFSIPVALLGVIYYSTIFLLSAAYLDTKNINFLKIAAYLTIIGFLASLWFVYLQFIIIGALCFYCMFSALTSTILFILGAKVILLM